MRVFLCEKPSQGKDIARVLGAGQRGNDLGEVGTLDRQALRSKGLGSRVGG